MSARDIEHANSQSGTIATRSSRAKTSGSPPPIHPGMTSRQVAGANLGGLGHAYAGAPDGSGANPLDPTVPGKRPSPPAIHPGMRSRTSPGLDSSAHRELGARVLAEAKGSTRP
jgi:hypothetical protein